MKSQTRAWIMTVLILLIWSTLVATPFKYFADMLADGAGWLLGKTGLSGAIITLLTYFLLGGLTCLFLVLGRRKYRLYLAGFFVLAVLVHHLIYCLRTNQLYDISLPIVLALALALVFLLIKNKTPGLWLSDAFIVALPVWLLFESLLILVYSLLKWPAGRWQPFLVVSGQPGILLLDELLGLPWQVWVVVPCVFAFLPLVFLARNREK